MQMDKFFRYTLLREAVMADVRFAGSGSGASQNRLLQMVRDPEFAKIAVQEPLILRRSNGYISVRDVIGALHPELLRGSEPTMSKEAVETVFESGLVEMPNNKIYSLH